VHEVLLHQRHESEQVASERLRPADADQLPEHPWIDMREHVPHHDRFLEAVEQHPARIGRVVAQDTPAEAVEGGDPARLPGARPRENSERPLDVVDVEWQSVYLWLVGRFDYAGA